MSSVLIFILSTKLRLACIARRQAGTEIENMVVVVGVKRRITMSENITQTVKSSLLSA
jgi:hypothetical protein